ncbi:MAG: PhoX family phosphatase [Hyphomicrobiaceae bacterium]
MTGPVDLDRLPTSQQYEEAENEGSNASANPTLGDVIAERFSRRDLMKGVLAVAAMAATVSPLALAAATRAEAQGTSTTPSFNFNEVAAGSDDTHHVAEGYDADVLIRWGDKVAADAPAFDPQKQTAEAQAKQFGYNNDFLGYIPLDGRSDHGLLVVNHEYTNEELMFPRLGRQDGKAAFAGMTKDLVDIEMMAHGGSVLEVRREDGKWTVVAGSRYARRITAATPMRISGPAAGHERMKTKEDPSGTKVLGMLNNCAGATTPWGTWLTCEENFNGYFWSKKDGQDGPDGKALKRYGAPGEWYNWGRYHDRFDYTKEPNEVNRFGWVVEIDPMDPDSVPVKRTAMGRFKHEGAGNAIAKGGQFVVYSGDDERFDYVYKFVTEGRVDTANRAANIGLLDKGTLYVAKFDADGSGEWLALVHGHGPLTATNGFKDQGEVVIHARLAADLVGATKMDRPEDIEVNRKTDKVYLMLTNNSRRKPDQVDAANPRANNRFGHIIEMIPDNGDHASTTFRWEILVRCGDPTIADVGATFNPSTSQDGWFGMPDNAVVDTLGRLWIATDGNSPTTTGRSDGIWAMETTGAARGTSKLFFRCPSGAEMCGPEMTPDAETFFVAVQHPGESEDARRPATFEAPSTRWPDFKAGMPPRPSVVAITRKGGGKIAV